MRVRTHRVVDVVAVVGVVGKVRGLNVPRGPDQRLDRPVHVERVVELVVVVTDRVDGSHRQSDVLGRGDVRARRVTLHEVSLVALVHGDTAVVRLQ